MRFSTAFALAVVTTTCCSYAGCNRGGRDASLTPGTETSATDAGAEQYDPHDVPITEEQKARLRSDTAQFGTAVARIKELRDAIERETIGGIPKNPFAAHQALDQADLVLQWLPQVARDSGVAKDFWEEINTAAGALRTSFEKVHQNIDNKQEPDFASVAQEIDQKIARLQEVAQTPEAKRESG